MSEIKIPDILTLAALQKHTADLCRHFGWNTMHNDQTFLLFIEEVGEMAKAIRKRIGLAEEKIKKDGTDNLAEEMADVLSYLADLANRYGIDLDKAYRDKMTHNLNREWGK